MVRPITWRNVDAPDFTGSARMLDQAGDNFTNAFSGLERVLGKYRGVQEGNRENTIERNTMKARDFLAGITDPEEMQRVQASGEFRDMVQGFGGMVDQEGLRGAGEERLTGLRQAQTANRAYQDSETRAANRESRDAHDVAIAEGRFDDALKIREETSFLDEGQMAQQQTRAERDLEQLEYTREQRANSAEDRARLARERETKKSQRELKNQTYARFTAPLEDGETYTTRKRDLNEFMKSDQFKFMAPSDRAEFKKTAQQSLEFGEAIAAGDQKKIDKFLKPVKNNLERNTFYAHENREGDDGARTRDIIDNYSEENSDEGIGLLMGEADGDDRMMIIQGVQAALGGRTPNGEVLLEGGIPEPYIRMALDGVRGGNLINFDSSFEDQLREVISSEAFRQDYEQYASLDSELKRMTASAQAAARNGETASADTVEPTPTDEADIPAALRRTPDTRNVTAPNTPGQNPRAPATAPALSNGEPVAEEPEPESQAAIGASAIPRPDFRELEDAPERDGFESGAGKIGRVFSNLGRRVSNAISEQQYNNQINTFEEMSSIIQSNDVGANEKRRLGELLRTNPGMLQFMTPEQRNNMRNILGEGMVNAIMK